MPTRSGSMSRPDFAEAKRECKRLHDEHLARAQQKYSAIPRSQQMRQRKGHQFEGNEEYDQVVDLKTGWRFYRQSRGNLQTNSSGSRTNLQTASSSSTWDQTRWKTGNWNSQHFSVNFSQSYDRFRLSGDKTSSQPTESVNSTPTNTARTELHSMITCHHANTHGSRSTIAHLCVSKTIVIHVSCLGPLPHLTLTTSTSSLSPISSTFLPFRRSHLCTKAL